MRRIPLQSLLLLASVATVALVGLVVDPSWRSGATDGDASPNPTVPEEARPRCSAQSTIEFASEADAAVLALKVLTVRRHGETENEWAARHKLAVRLAPRSLIGADPGPAHDQSSELHSDDQEYTIAKWTSAGAGEIEVVVEFDGGEDSQAIVERRASIDNAFLREFPPNS